MGVRIGIVGVGAFAHSFIRLYARHPLVDRLALCDLDAPKLAKAAAEFGVTETYPSLDALCQSDLDACVLMTQNWLHGPQAVQALRAGKHVYSAVPAGITVDEIAALVRAVTETGRLYMLGETSSYRPEVLYCRRRRQAGDFGRVVAAEAEYYHDMDHGLYEVMQRRGGERWREVAGSPPLHYPTHSTSQVILVTGSHMTHVSAQGFVDRHPDGLFAPGANRWGNTFSDESALFRMADGSSCRINEFRRVGHPSTERLSLVVGTEATFENNAVGAVWLTKDARHKEWLDELLTCRGVDTPHGQYPGLAPIHPVDRLPKEFAGLPTGHGGSHHFLVDDFVRACATGEQPLNNVWLAARYVLPGLVGHESALRGGELLPVPDYGDPPAATPR